MKKILAVLLAMSLVFAFAVTAAADDVPTSRGDDAEFAPPAAEETPVEEDTADEANESGEAQNL